MLCFLLLLDDL